MPFSRLLDDQRVPAPSPTPVLPVLAPTVAVPATTTPCQEHDVDLWFAERTAEVERAKALCGACPVQQSCLAGALERREPWGVWGGQVFVEGVVVARKRGRGRPRKAA